jgi:hypothetical protein
VDCVVEPSGSSEKSTRAEPYPKTNSTQFFNEQLVPHLQPVTSRLIFGQADACGAAMQRHGSWGRLCSRLRGADE